MKKLLYKGNPKHREPWQPGRRGSLCPREVDLEQAQAMLDSSELVGKKRYAVWRGRAFCGQSEDGGSHWHGSPVGWVEVPPAVWRGFLKRGEIRRRDIRRYWEKQT